MLSPPPTTEHVEAALLAGGPPDEAALLPSCSTPLSISRARSRVRAIPSPETYAILQEGLQGHRQTLA